MKHTQYVKLQYVQPIPFNIQPSQDIFLRLVKFLPGSSYDRDVGCLEQLSSKCRTNAAGCWRDKSPWPHDDERLGMCEWQTQACRTFDVRHTVNMSLALHLESGWRSSHGRSSSRALKLWQK